MPTVHLAIHGATYSHLYWGWPYRPEIHSYAGHLLAARHLRYFVAVAEKGSLTVAAERRLHTAL